MNHIQSPFVSEQEEDTLQNRYLIFSLGDEEFALEIRHVTEIVGLQPITFLPEMPAYIKGIINLRGSIVPIMDLRLRFGKETRAYDERTCIVICHMEDINIGLIVDRVSEVSTIPAEDVASTPAVKNESHRFVKGICKSDGKVKLILDSHKIIAEDDIPAVKKSVPAARTGGEGR
ncbi:MAG TPA: purine-binding chemotaxis protein CheW [Clostridiales bacterium]|nr:purine-binding chemotaxis protein CheW [Clostridiales bacterium]